MHAASLLEPRLRRAPYRYRPMIRHFPASAQSPRWRTMRWFVKALQLVSLACPPSRHRPRADRHGRRRIAASNRVEASILLTPM